MAQRRQVATPEEQMWTSFQVAERFGVNVESVRRWVRKGAIVPIRLGGPQGDRFPESEVQRFMVSKQPHVEADGA